MPEVRDLSQKCERGRVDRLRRTRYTAEYKREVLDAFESSGLSGSVFARRCGIKYPTFATWLAKRRN